MLGDGGWWPITPTAKDVGASKGGSGLNKARRIRYALPVLCFDFYLVGKRASYCSFFFDYCGPSCTGIVSIYIESIELFFQYAIMRHQVLIPIGFSCWNFAIYSLSPLRCSPLKLNSEVRDSWALHYNPAASSKATPVVNYENDTWEDADLEPVMAWLEDTLKDRRTKTRRRNISKVSWDHFTYLFGVLFPAYGYQFGKPKFAEIHVCDRTYTHTLDWGKVVGFTRVVKWNRYHQGNYYK